MSAFARALAALHRDANLSVACTWYPGWDRDEQRAFVLDNELADYIASVTGTAVRGIRSQEQAPAFGAGSLGGIAGREFLDVAVADLPAVKRGDFIVIGGSTYRVETTERDIEALTWRLTLSDAAA